MPIENNFLPKKSLGQHWLNDSEALTAMADAAGVNQSDVVLEIGPGLGSLTAVLLARGARVIGVEIDQNLAGNLTSKFSGANFSLVQQDILQFDFTRMPASYKVVANIPYYLTSNLIRVLCESPNPFSQAALLVQKEVAQRAAAAPGSLSILAVSAQFYCDVTLGQLVPAALFEPPPKVDSQILSLKFRRQPLLKDVDTKQFFRLVKAGFSQKRKTLENALSGGLVISKTEARNLLESAGISPSERAQALSLADWHELYKAFSPLPR